MLNMRNLYNIFMLYKCYEKPFDKINMAVIYSGMGKDLSIKKEVLAQMVDGVYADSVNEAIETLNPNLRLESQNILLLRRDIRDAETEEELEAISKKLKEYSFGLDIVSGDK
ncbi:hypothetical protein AGMMS49928_01040 [Spirochaetia bacterium]|nr:hypothetical protein AGMMS49928_01040 [Spirochaetia bacterium]